LTCTHHWKGNAGQCWKAHVNLGGLYKLLGFVDVQSKETSPDNTENNEETPAQSCKVLAQHTLSYVSHCFIHYFGEMVKILFRKQNHGP
jgi:hypothetical protein